MARFHRIRVSWTTASVKGASSPPRLPNIFMCLSHQTSSAPRQGHSPRRSVRDLRFLVLQAYKIRLASTNHSISSGETTRKCGRVNAAFVLFPRKFSVAM